MFSITNDPRESILRSTVTYSNPKIQNKVESIILMMAGFRFGGFDRLFKALREHATSHKL